MPHRSHLPKLILTCATAAAAVVIGSSPARAADADIRLTGGDSNAAIVCGNVATAQQLARQRGIPIQRSRCTAAATGGSVTLANAEIRVSAMAMAANRGNALLELLSAPTISEDRCESHRPSIINGIQINQCWAISRGGRANLNGVTTVTKAADGSVSTRTLNQISIPTGTTGAANSKCTNVLNDPLNQRDDCTGSAGGGAWSIRGVDVVLHNADGSTSTRRGINIDIRGGSATAYMYCFNVTDGSGMVAQINICNADARGGDVNLQNVRFNFGV